ncbi:MAG: DUF1998 domain-containing protein [Rhodothermus sp.]|nr:DUF1998 domain-containing protein [Rhodothermus sp.]
MPRRISTSRRPRGRKRRVRALIRSSQIITPFSSGSIFTTPGGVSVVISSPAEWRYIDKNREDVHKEYIIHDARLEEFLDVKELRLPPDLIKVYRFPRWHFCNRCGVMRELGMSESLMRPSCPAENCPGEMVQVRFVAVCRRGHLQDVDWNGWVHRGGRCPHGDTTRLKWISGDQPGVRCENCGQYRPVEQLVWLPFGNGEIPGYLRCRGEMPWLGNRREECKERLMYTLKRASNVCFPVVKSSINLSGIREERLRALVRILESKQTLLSLNNNEFINLIREICSDDFRKLGLNPDTISPEELLYAKDIACGKQPPPWKEARPDEVFRKMEYDLLRSGDVSVPGLEIRQVPPAEVPDNLKEYFSHIARVEKMIETRVLVGFTRAVPEYSDQEELKRMLWGEERPDWLPATVVHGEGIFLEFSREKLQEWKEKYCDFIETRVNKLQNNQDRSLADAEGTHIFKVTLSEEFILIHTFAHMIINELVFECGYSSASLRERLYVGRDMTGVLIYTASGDAEGTLGGLVAMAEPTRFGGVVRRVLRRASWCSVDPVCSELGEQGGQGPDNCNLAACYACAMVPETACEHLNRWLDRGLVVGTPWNREAGFLADLNIT